MHTSIYVARILRDFFLSSSPSNLACNSLALQSALPHVVPSVEQPVAAHAEKFLCGADGAETPWQEVEQEFKSLFVGAEPLAPPYASAYLQRYADEIGGTCLLSCDIFYALGLELSAHCTHGSDHISMELDGWLCMEEMLRCAANPYQLANLRAGHRWLVCTHMGTWVPSFVQHSLTQNRVSFPIRHALYALEFWIKAEIAAPRCAC